MPYYTISAIDESTGVMTDEVVEAVDLEMAGAILASRGLAVHAVIGQAVKDPRLLAGGQHTPAPPIYQQAPPARQQSTFTAIVLALLFVFVGIPLIIFVAVPVSLMIIAWLVGVFA